MSLRGLRVLVTRRAEQSGELVRRLADAGAQVAEIPAIAVEPPEDPGPLDAALGRLASFDWVAFTSVNAVRSATARAPEGAVWPRLAAVGPATAKALEDALGRPPDLVPERDFRASGLAAAFAALEVAGRRVLLPLGDRARDTLKAALLAAGAEVHAVVAYRTQAAPGAAAALLAALDRGVDVVLFASPSAVESVAALAGTRALGLPAGVLGAVTHAAASAAGFSVRAIAEPSTLDGLIGALEAAAAAGHLTPRR
jgi:uroporphyrinogen-III synthase